MEILILMCIFTTFIWRQRKMSNRSSSSITEENINILLDSIVTRIPVSMDAISPKTYSQSRGGNYYQLMKNVFNFLELREKRNQRLPLLRVSFVRYNLTEHETDDFIRFWKK